MQVQMFYAWRIHRLTGNTLVVAAVVITSLVGGRALPLHIYLRQDIYFLQWSCSVWYRDSDCCRHATSIR